MKKRHKKEKQLEVQAASVEQHHESGSGDGSAQPIVVEEHVAVDSREGEKHFPSSLNEFLFKSSWVLFVSSFLS